MYLDTRDACRRHRESHPRRQASCSRKSLRHVPRTWAQRASLDSSLILSSHVFIFFQIIKMNPFETPLAPRLFGIEAAPMGWLAADDVVGIEASPAWQRSCDVHQAITRAPGPYRSMACLKSTTGNGSVSHSVVTGGGAAVGCARHRPRRDSGDRVREVCGCARCHGQSAIPGAASW